MPKLFSPDADPSIGANGIDYIYDYDGHRVPTDEIYKILTSAKFFGEEGVRRWGLVATDMDGTLFKNDLGILVFLEKLLDKDFWSLQDKRFKALLLPRAYLDRVEKMRNSEDKEISTLASRIMDLHCDIPVLYSLVKSYQGKSFSDNNWEVAVMSEFASRMIIFDQLIMALEKHFSESQGGDLLMRIRFLVEKNRAYVSKLVKAVIDSTDIEPVRLGNSRISSANVDLDSKLPNLKIPCRELQPTLVSKKVEIVGPVYQILGSFRQNGSVKGHPVIGIVTTNLQEIAQSAIMFSLYRNLIDSGDIVGTRLQSGQDHFRARIDGKPLFGEYKKLGAQWLQDRYRRLVLCALGDSPFGDGEMMFLSLENGGRVVIVCNNLEDGKAIWSKTLKSWHERGIEDPHKRVYFVTAGH